MIRPKFGVDKVLRSTSIFMFPALSRVFFERGTAAFRGFSVSSYEQFIDKECISKALNKKPNEHYHIFSTRVGNRSTGDV